MIITRTPYRLSFFGGGTDYNPWFEEHGGLVIAVGIAHYCYLTVRYLPPFFEHRSRIVYSKIESVAKNQEIIHPSVRGCLEYLKISDGIEIHHDGDLPARSGIGSSSSFTVGLLHALHALHGRMRSSEQLALEAIEVEQVLLRESVGIQDQIMAAHGGCQFIDMKPGGKWTINNVLLPADYLKELESHILFGFSGISRLAERHARAKVDNIKRGKTTEELKGIHALAREALHLFSQQASFEAIAELLDKSWHLKCRLAEGVSASWMDDLYQTALRAGAFGGKLMGAGGGGFFFFIAPPEKHQKIREALPQIKVWVPFQIDHGGSQVILYNPSPKA
ncbi:MAG: kinase [Cyanobacteria bacterium SBLK]|nr:kinase [Cyanobacteria bacterium SBLK]